MASYLVAAGAAVCFYLFTEGVKQIFTVTQLVHQLRLGRSAVDLITP